MPGIKDHEREFPRELLINLLRRVKEESCPPEQLETFASAVGLPPIEFQLFTSSQKRIEDFAGKLADYERRHDALRLARALARYWPASDHALALETSLGRLAVDGEAPADGPDISSYRSSIDLKYAHRYSLTGDEDFVGREEELRDLNGWVRGDYPDAAVLSFSELPSHLNVLTIDRLKPTASSAI